MSALDAEQVSIIQSNVSGNELNLQANLHEYLIGFLVDLPVSSWNTIGIQSSSLLELSEETNQLTRSFLVGEILYFRPHSIEF